MSAKPRNPKLSFGAKLERIDLSLLGLTQKYDFILYNPELVNKTTETIHQMYTTGSYTIQRLRGDGTVDVLSLEMPDLADALAVMLACIGTSYTAYRQSNKGMTVPNIINRFQEYARLVQAKNANLREQIRYHAISVSYNSGRSTNGNTKSNTQKAGVHTVFEKFVDCRLRNYTIKEVTDQTDLNPRPDGLIAGNGRLHRKKDIMIYLRYGDAGGGSQTDRKATMEKSAQAHPNVDFLFICDGLEVDEDFIRKLNKFPNVYATRTKDLDETKLLELYDRQQSS